MFASYLDTTFWPTTDMVAHSKLTGQKWYTLAFIVSQGGDPSFGGFYKIIGNSSDWFYDRIQALRDIGGDVIISFGGQAGLELSQANSNVQTLYSKYKLVIDTYKPKIIDYDIEGQAIADAVSIDLRNKALAMINKNYPNVQINYTLPVMPDGLDWNGIDLVQNAKKNNVKVGCFNVMVMDFSSSITNMSQSAIDAAQATRKQIIAAGYSDSKIGLTPMIGVNDIKTEIFTIADAKKVLDFANKTDYISLLSFWSVQRDNKTSGISQSPNEFTDIFKTFKPVGTAPIPVPNPTPVPTPTPGTIKPGDVILGETVAQDYRPQWYKIHNVSVGNTSKYSYTQTTTNNIGITLDALSRDSTVLAVDYDTINHIAYAKKGYDSTSSTDVVRKPGYLSWIRSPAAAATVVPSPAPTPTGSFHFPAISLSGGMTPVQNCTTMSLMSIPENGDVAWWKYYGYCEHLSDGDGMTFGIPQCTSRTGDGLALIKSVQKLEPGNSLCAFIPALTSVNGTADITGLDGLIQACKDNANNQNYQKAQWQIMLDLYWNPAMQYCADNNITLPISKSVVFDCQLNVGDTTTVQSKVKTPTPKNGGNEISWLNDFLNTRQSLNDVNNPENYSWNQGQNDRMVMFRNLVAAGNYQLVLPINNLQCYGSSYSITQSSLA